MKKAYKFGVEIELVIPYGNTDQFKDAIRRLGCYVKGDGSIKYGDDETGLEITTPPVGLNKLHRLLTKIEKICEANNATVNKSCGLHVHTSNKRFFIAKNLRRIVGTWVAIEDVLIATQPASRYNNEYCKRRIRQYVTNGFPKLPNQKQEIVNRLSREDRYYTLNLASMAKHGTLECRLHAGTTQSRKIINWVKVLVAIYNYAIEDYKTEEVKALFDMETSEAKITKVWEVLKVEKSVSNYMDERIQKFLLPKLAKQQASAKKILELRPLKLKVTKRMAEAQAVFNRVRNEESELLQQFGY